MSSHRNATQLNLRMGSSSANSQRRRRRKERKTIIRVAGLENLNNTCFLNAVLQCQMSTPGFREIFLKGAHHHKTCTKTKEGGLCLICVYFIYTTQSTRGGIIVPHDLVENLHNFQSGYRRGRQEDAQECFIQLCDAYQSAATKFASESDSDSYVPVSGGKLCSQRTCEQCHAVQNKYEAFEDLSLTAEKPTLIAALANFTTPEPIEFTCPRRECASKTATQRLLISKNPKVLVLHLKRFEHDSVTGTIRKIKHHIQFPMVLDVGRFVEQQPTPSAVYDLTAVCVHHGETIASGHTTAYVLDEDNWVHADDKRVSQVSSNAVLKENAYMLFYQRRPASADNSNASSNVSDQAINKQPQKVAASDNKHANKTTTAAKKISTDRDKADKVITQRQTVPTRRTYAEVFDGIKETMPDLGESAAHPPLDSSAEKRKSKRIRKPFIGSFPVPSPLIPRALRNRPGKKWGSALTVEEIDLTSPDGVPHRVWLRRITVLTSTVPAFVAASASSASASDPGNEVHGHTHCTTTSIKHAHIKTHIQHTQTHTLIHRHDQ
jgi:ubiquitin C-terminal hydrolase